MFKQAERAGRAVYALLSETGSAWSRDRSTSQAAALSYYTVFSIAPILIISVAVAGMVFGQDAVQGNIQKELQGLLGAAGAKVIESMVVSASKTHSGIIATALGVLALCLGACGVFVELRDALNRIWQAPPRSKTVGRGKLHGIFEFLRARFLSFAMVLVICFLLLVSLVLSTALAAFGGYLSRFHLGDPWIWHTANLAVSFGVITILFAMIYKVLPDAAVRWSDVWLGAAATSLMFSLGKMGIGFYLGQSAVASTYGAASSVCIVLIWVYYSAQILLFGAEFTRVYSDRKRQSRKQADSRTVPSNPTRGSKGAPIWATLW